MASPVERMKRTIENLRVDLRVHKDKKDRYKISLKKYNCRSTRDIKKAIRKLNKEKSILEAQIDELVQEADAIIAEMNEGEDDD